MNRTAEPGLAPATHGDPEGEYPITRRQSLTFTAAFAALAVAALALDAHSRGVAWAIADAEVALLAYVAAGEPGDRTGPWDTLAIVVCGVLLAAMLAAAATLGTLAHTFAANARASFAGGHAGGLRPPVLGLCFPLFAVSCAALSDGRRTYAIHAAAALLLVLAWPVALVAAFDADPETLLAGTGALPLAAAALGWLHGEP